MRLHESFQNQHFTFSKVPCASSYGHWSPANPYSIILNLGPATCVDRYCFLLFDSRASKTCCRKWCVNESPRLQRPTGGDAAQEGRRCDNMLHESRRRRSLLPLGSDFCRELGTVSRVGSPPASACGGVFTPRFHSRPEPRRGGLRMGSFSVSGFAAPF